MEGAIINKSLQKHVCTYLYVCHHLSLPTFFQFQKKVNSVILNVPLDFCMFTPLSPKDANEEKVILKSIAWPDTPPLPSPFSLNGTSDPAHSTFTILPRRSRGPWHTGDKLEVFIKMYNFQGRPKKTGGDVIVARLHSPTLGAGVAGQVVDHLNGSYTAVFSLLWEGRAQVEVTQKQIYQIDWLYCFKATCLFTLTNLNPLGDSCPPQ